MYDNNELLRRHADNIDNYYLNTTTYAGGLWGSIKICLVYSFFTIESYGIFKIV